jgi:ABC-2 type transport system ATP-binding protein
LQTSLIHVEDLTIQYGRKIACNHVSFRAPQGSVYALLGRNGAGKSSLVRCLLGQQKPHAGEVRLFGRPVWRDRARIMRKVGVVPEDPDAPPEMTARELASFCARLYPTWDHDAFGARLARFGIPPNLPFQNLSKGQRGMLQFALALAPHPELLILDDPTLGQDVVARRSTLEDLVGDLADRAPTVFITTHDLIGIEGIADRVGILKAGRLVVDMNLEELKSSFRRIQYRKECPGEQAGAYPELQMFQNCQIRSSSFGVEAVVSNYDETRCARFQASPGICDATILPMSLEEVLIAVSGGDVEGQSCSL